MQPRHNDNRSASQASPRQVRGFIARWRMRGVAAFAVIMLAGALVGMLFFARPATSETERRNLTEFPELNVESFLNGDYFTQVSLWYADTYPLREPMVAADHAIDGLFGVSVNQGLVGGNVHADEIPVDDFADAGGGDGTASTAGLAAIVEDVSDRAHVPAEAPDDHVVAEAIQDSIMDGLYIKDGAAYSVYYFNQEGADTYIDAVNAAYEKLGDTMKVYSLLVPSSAVALSDEEYEGVGGSDQRQTLDYVRTRLKGRVKQVDALDTLRDHADDYVFFRTDHHWTMRGAYYAYAEFCKERGVEPKPLDSYAYGDGGEFTGTYYESIAELMAPAVDSFETYTPSGTNEMTCWGAEGDERTAAVVEDTSSWESPAGKYDALSGCDPASSLIHNPSVADGSTCLVVKDSYGCAFEPFLVDDYENVYSIDPRYFEGNLCDFAREKGVQDIVFVYGIKVGLDQRYASLLNASIG